MIVQIPFDGFYQSITESLIDDVIEEITNDYQNDVSYSVDFLRIAIEYVSQYQEVIKDNFDIELKLAFHRLKSPREYNFHTDKIFVEVTQKDINALYEHVLNNPEETTERLKSLFDSCSGFHSFYPDFSDDWQDIPIDDWDENMVYGLFPVPDNYIDLWESVRCNGFFHDVVSY